MEGNAPTRKGTGVFRKLGASVPAVLTATRQSRFIDGNDSNLDAHLRTRQCGDPDACPQGRAVAHAPAELVDHGVQVLGSDLAVRVWQVIRVHVHYVAPGGSGCCQCSVDIVEGLNDFVAN